MKGPMFRIHPRQNGFDLSITGHFLEVHMSENDETCLYCHCDVTRGQGVNPIKVTAQAGDRENWATAGTRHLANHPPEEKENKPA